MSFFSVCPNRALTCLRRVLRKSGLEEGTNRKLSLSLIAAPWAEAMMEGGMWISPRIFGARAGRDEVWGHD